MCKLEISSGDQQGVSISKLFFSYRRRSTLSLWLLFGIFVQNVLETNLNCRYQRIGNSEKIKALNLSTEEVCYGLSTFKIDMTKGPLFFQISYLLVSKIKKEE